jgi:hypothetical protein
MVDQAREDLVRAVADRIDSIAAEVTVEEMALPVDSDPESNLALQRLVRVYALLQARRSLAQIPGQGNEIWQRVRDGVIGGQPDLADALTRLTASPELFSFVDPSAGNWQFGRELARVLRRTDDFAIVAPSATWIVRVLQRTDYALRDLVSPDERSQHTSGSASWLHWIFRRGHN